MCHSGGWLSVFSIQFQTMCQRLNIHCQLAESLLFASVTVSLCNPVYYVIYTWHGPLLLQKQSDPIVFCFLCSLHEIYCLKRCSLCCSTFPFTLVIQDFFLFFFPSYGVVLVIFGFCAVWRFIPERPIQLNISYPSRCKGLTLQKIRRIH